MKNIVSIRNVSVAGGLTLLVWPIMIICSLLNSQGFSLCFSHSSRYFPVSSSALSICTSKLLTFFIVTAALTKYMPATNMQTYSRAAKILLLSIYVDIICNNARVFPLFDGANDRSRRVHLPSLYYDILEMLKYLIIHLYKYRCNQS